MWTTRLLARHAREHGPAEGQLASPSRILDEQEIKPRKVRYYLDHRDPEFEKRWPKYCAVIAR
jgi:hypothetical protein